MRKGRESYSRPFGVQGGRRVWLRRTAGCSVGDAGSSGMRASGAAMGSNARVMSVFLRERGNVAARRKKKGLWYATDPFFLVPGARLELARCCHRRILSPLRLPIPPSRRVSCSDRAFFSYAKPAVSVKPGTGYSVDLSRESSRTAPSTRALPSQPMGVNCSCQNSQTHRVLSTGSR